MYLQHGGKDFLVSTWDAGQSYLTSWSGENVRLLEDERIALILNRSHDSAARPWLGGELQSEAAFTTGSWSWMAQAPRMVDGTVFGLFLYQDDYRVQPWREFDIEFVGGDTTRIHLAVHFEDGAGHHVSLRQPMIVDLGFDAADAPHVYEIEVTEKAAFFRVDGRAVARIGPEHVEGGIWDLGPLASLADLWATPPELTPWAGQMAQPPDRLTAYVENIRLPSDSTVFGKGGADDLRGTSGEDLLYGFGGNDTLRGGAAADRMIGGTGNDTYIVDHAGDEVVERAGEGLDRVSASVSHQLAAHVERLVLTGTAAINGAGNGLANVLWGNGAANRLSGGGGNDRVEGRDGSDVLNGGTGHDTLIGGAGHDRLAGGTGSDRLVGGSGNDRLDGGIDRDVLTGGAGADTFVFAAGYGRDVITDFRVGNGGDRLEIHDYAAPLELRQVGGGTLIVFSETDSILLQHVRATALDAEDFLFC